MHHEASRLFSLLYRHRGRLLPFGLAGLLLFHGINNWHLMTQTTGMVLNDQTSYFSFMLKVISAVREGEWRTLLFEQVRQVWKPPLFMLVSAPLLLIQRSVHMAAMANIFFLGLAMLGIYFSGKRLYGRAAGAAAAFIFCMVPVVFAMSRVFLLETALSAMVALTFSLFAAGRFRSLPVAAATGAVMGLGMLTKQPYAVFVLPFFLYYAFPEGRAGSPVRPSRAAFAAGVAALIASFWYLHGDRLSIGHYNWYVSVEYGSSDPLFYLKALFARQLFPVFFVFAAISMLHAVRRRKFFFPAYIVLMLVLFSLSPNRHDRFILPLFPFIALMMGDTLVALAQRRAAVYALVLAGCFVQYGLISHRPQHLFRLVPSLERSFPYNTDENRGIYAIAPQQDDWKRPVAQLLDSLEPYAHDGARPPTVVDLSVVGCELEYQVLAQRRNYRLEYQCLGLETRKRTVDELKLLSATAMERADIVVRSLPTQVLFFYWDQWPFLDEAFARDAGKFRLVARIPCPRGNTLLAYVRTAPGRHRL